MLINSSAKRGCTGIRAAAALFLAVTLLISAPAGAQEGHRITLGPSATTDDLAAALRESAASVTGPRLESTLSVIPPVSLDLKVEFAFDSAAIAPTWQPLLDRLANALQAQDIQAVRFRVDGHTDARGSDAYNRSLSERRAAAVVDYLSRRGVAAHRLDAKGFGESRLIPGLPGDDSRQRRVEITASR